MSCGVIFREARHQRSSVIFRVFLLLFSLARTTPGEQGYDRRKLQGDINALSGITTGWRRSSARCTTATASTIRQMIKLTATAAATSTSIIMHIIPCSGVIIWERSKLAQHKSIQFLYGGMEINSPTATNIKNICTKMSTSKFKAPLPVGIHTGTNDIDSCLIMLTKIVN